MSRHHPSTPRTVGSGFMHLEPWMREERLVAALDVALRGLSGPCSTRNLSGEIAARLGAPDTVVSRFLMGVAPVVSEAKRLHEREGPSGVPWQWSPRRSATPAAPAQSAVETYTDAEGVVRARHVEPPEEW